MFDVFDMNIAKDYSNFQRWGSGKVYQGSEIEVALLPVFTRIHSASIECPRQQKLSVTSFTEFW